jgi:hypothetical protein
MPPEGETPRLLPRNNRFRVNRAVTASLSVFSRRIRNESAIRPLPAQIGAARPRS